ncbi:hypothetical protein HDE_01041 [Halotydeus destructor]|nr:hypothetical protein HDE_01041 [Halotydeus destructor]
MLRPCLILVLIQSIQWSAVSGQQTFVQKSPTGFYGEDTNGYQGQQMSPTGFNNDAARGQPAQRSPTGFYGEDTQGRPVSQDFYGANQNGGQIQAGPAVQPMNAMNQNMVNGRR